MVELVIDCGHGGADNGAVFKDRLEKDFNLLNGVYLYNRFRELQIDCVLTRDTDTTLENGTRVATVKQGQRCISNHLNATEKHTAKHGEVIHSIFSNAKWANLVRQEWESIGQPTKVYSRSTNKSQDYYFMHRFNGSN